MSTLWSCRNARALLKPPHTFTAKCVLRDGRRCVHVCFLGVCLRVAVCLCVYSFVFIYVCMCVVQVYTHCVYTPADSEE